MPWCPKCNADYREGYTVCGSCGSKLCELDGTPKNAGKNLRQGVNETLLANVGDAVELAYITSMLDSEKIPYRTAEGDVGQYLSILHGRSFFGKCVLVKSEDFEKAAVIAASSRAVTEPYDEGAAEASPAREEWGYRLLALAYLVCGLLIGVI